MKHAGKAKQAGIQMIVWSLVALLLLITGGVIASLVGTLISALATTLLVLWFVFLLFCLNFFRDPDPKVPPDPQAIVSPAHGKVDLIDETQESEFMGGKCRRVSIFLSVFDVHVQNAPISGKVAFQKHTPGQFLNAMKAESSLHNENVLIGLESSEAPGERVAFRLIAGLLARRIVPWITLHDQLQKGDRTSLIRFGSRVDLYLPLTAKVRVRLGDSVRGGETIIATRSGS